MVVSHEASQSLLDRYLPVFRNERRGNRCPTACTARGCLPLRFTTDLQSAALGMAMAASDQLCSRAMLLRFAASVPRSARITVLFGLLLVGCAEEGGAPLPGPTACEWVNSKRASCCLEEFECATARDECYAECLMGWGCAEQAKPGIDPGISACLWNCAPRFTCDDGTEIYAAFVCDDEGDCAGSEDEKNCEAPESTMPISTTSVAEVTADARVSVVDASVDSGVPGQASPMIGLPDAASLGETLPFCEATWDMPVASTQGSTSMPPAPTKPPAPPKPAPPVDSPPDAGARDAATTNAASLDAASSDAASVTAIPLDGAASNAALLPEAGAVAPNTDASAVDGGAVTMAEATSTVVSLPNLDAAVTSASNRGSAQ